MENTTFFAFLSTLCERLDEEHHKYYKSQLNNLPNDPKIVKSIGCALISLSCLGHMKEQYLSFCSSVDNYFAGMPSGDEQWIASFRTCDAITKAAYEGFQQATRKTEKLTQELLRYEKIRLHAYEEIKSLQEMKAQTTREKKIYREVEIQDKNTHAMMYNLLTMADMQNRVLRTQQTQTKK